VVRLARLEDPDEVTDLRAWLTRVIGRLALDALRRVRHARESYVGEWLPEPVVSDAAGTGHVAPDDPADRVTLDESVTMALLVVLESLSPAERTAFVLHDVSPRTACGAATAVDTSARCATRYTAATASPRRRSGSPGAPPRPPRSRSSTAGRGLVERDSRGVLTVRSFTVEGGRIVGIESMRNPEQLDHVGLL
jgi:RNA polymerase sigma-70 factor (ECF subfamily)